MALDADSMVLLDAVDQVRTFVDTFVLVYILVIFVYIITSWVRLPYSPTLNRIQRFLYDVSEPYLKLFRRIVPPLGPLDLSPLVAVFALVLMNRIVDRLLDQL
jgi:YggT family protein